MKNTEKTTETTEKKAATLTKEELRRKVVRVASSVRAGLVIDFPGGARTLKLRADEGGNDV